MIGQRLTIFLWVMSHLRVRRAKLPLLPIAPRDHQTANAAALVRAGAAILVPDDELDGARLVRELLPLLDDPARLAAMGEAARSLARPDAADRVADLVEANARRV